MKSGKERRGFRCTVPIVEMSVLCLVLFFTTIAGEMRNNGCSPGLETPGVTLPQGDVALLYGTPLEVLCILDPEHPLALGRNSSDLGFYRGQDPVDPEFLTVVNSTTLRLHIPRPAMSDSMYYCKLQREKDSVAVCLNHVTVGTPPQAVDNFRCISLNWENLTCTWKPPHNFLKTQYSLSFRLPRRSGRASVYVCPNMTLDTESGNYSCFWDLSTSPLYRQSYPTYYFNLTASNKFDYLSQDFNFNHYAHVKPSRPVALKVGSKTAHSAELNWTTPYPMQNFPVGLLHRIVYRTDLDPTWHPMDTSSLLLKSEKHSYNLTNLPYAFRYYNVRVSIRSEQAVGEEFWSDYTSTTFLTLGEPPVRPPDVDQGSFEVTANLNHRNVCIYWRQVNIFEENGENFVYKVEVRMEGVKIDVKPTQSKKGYIFYHGLPFKPLEFTVVSSNVEGDSPNKSRLIVPAQNQILSEPSYFTKAALGNGTYELTWKPPNVNTSMLESYTLFWCDNSRDRPFQCEGRLDWERVPANMTSRNYTVNDDKIYQFAISANGYGTSSGMVWASCTIIPNKAIGKIKEIWIIKVDSTVIEVGWKLECPDNVGVIKGYRIFYCPIVGLQNTACRDPISNITVIKSVPDTRGKIRGLRPYTTYAIQVSIIAHHEVGPQSDPLLSTTGEGPPDPPRNPSISDLSATRMLVSWEPPINMNGVLLYYLVNYRKAYRDWEYVQVDKSNGFTEATLMNLSCYTNYTITVQACTVACSVPSQELYVRTAIGRPGLVDKLKVITYDEHRVSWEPPSSPGGTLDLYEVRVLKVGKNNNITDLYNTTETEIIIPEKVCQIQGVLTNLYSVRAINYDAADDHGARAFLHQERVKVNRRPPGDNNIVTYVGPWSVYAENTCTPGAVQSYLFYWVIGIVMLFIIVALIMCINKTWKVIEKMRSIKPIMPEGLFPDAEKDSKYPLGNWNPPPKHNKEHDKQYPAAPADEVSLLGAPPMAPASPGAPRDMSGFSGTTTSTSLSGGSSRRAGSPAWPALAPYSAMGVWAPDDFVSDTDVTPTNTDTPYVSFAPDVSKINNDYVSDGYVQASIDTGHKEILPLTRMEPVSMLPPTYVMTAPENAVPSPVRDIPPLVALDTCVSPYVTVDDPRICAPSVPSLAASNRFPPVAEMKKDNTSGYVKHDDMMFNGPQSVPSSSYVTSGPEIITVEHPTIPKRISAPPLISMKSANDDKRISLNYTAGLESSDPACSPEYCRFGWNGPEQVDFQQPRQEPRPDNAPPSIILADLGKEDYELSLEDLMPEETEPVASTTTASHYLPLNLQPLKS